ncbi:MAG: trehalose-phosphatase [Actinomycetota bacterium]
MSDVDATVATLSARPAATALFVDFDGSLAPIVNDPAAARALPEAIAVLASLTRRLGRVAVVSGRGIEFLAARLPVPGLVLSGQYGLESQIDGQRCIDPRVEAFLDLVESAARAAERRLPGVLVERKGYVSVTLHWRTDPAREAEVRTVASDLAREFGLDTPQRGRRAVELRPPVALDKGTAVSMLVEGYRVGAFAGDDSGDLPGFAALAAAARSGRLDAAVRIGVLSPEAPADLPAAVDVTVDGPEGLVELLGRVRDQVA